MTRANQNQLHAQLQAATDPDERRSLALNLLAITCSRQMVDEALHALEHLPPDDSARPVLREKALYYLEHSDKDSGARIREKLMRLLGRILDGTRDDGLLYFGLMALAAARDDSLTTLLYERARHCARGDVRGYMKAAGLTARPDREAVLEGLTRRL